jgi:hypothetical protein
MKPAPSSPPAPPAAEFADGLGVRVRLAEKAGDELGVLRLAPEFVAVPAFEFALRERVNRLADFRHGAYARVRRVDRFEGGAVLGIVSEHAAGARLSQVLAAAEQHALDVDTNAALCIIRQLVPAVAVLHQHARDVAHGALAPERLLVTPDTRIVVTDYVLGSAIDQLRLSRDRLWRDIRIAIPPGAGSPRLDQRSDVMQIGVVALALLVGRPLQRDELRTMTDVIGLCTERTVKGERVPLSAPLRRWLVRTVQIEPRGSFATASEAQQGLEDVITGEPSYTAAPAALDAFMAKYREAVGLPSEGPRLTVPPLAPLPGPITVVPPASPSTPPSAASIPRASGPAPVGTPKIVPPVAAAPAPPAQAAVVLPLPAAPAAEPISGRALSVQPFADPPQPVAASTVASLSSSRSGRHRTGIGLDLHGSSSDTAHGRRSDLDEGTLAFERSLAEAAAKRQRRWRFVERIVLAIVVALAIAEGIVIKYSLLSATTMPGSTGAFMLDSRPSGVSVLIDGEARGATPLNLRLKGGPHVLELRAGSRSRVLPITIKNGETVSHYVELPSVAVTGGVDIRRAPGARIRVDGLIRGTSPLRVLDLTPGTHDVLFETRGGKVHQPVQVQAGVTTVIGPVESTPTRVAAEGDGWVDVKTPYEMSILEGGKVIGSSTAGKLPLTAGTHELEIVNEALQFRTTSSVTITAGEVFPLHVALPMGTLTLESDAPADVLVDGVKVGTTPISSLAIAIGPHQVNFLNPQLGQLQRLVTVTASEPVKLSVTFKQP